MANEIITTDIAKAQSIDFVNQFNGSIKKLMEAMGTTRLMPLSSGMIIKTYKAIKTMANKTVAEGTTIPLSKIEIKLANTYELEYAKYRKAVSAEAIQRSGYDVAVAETDSEMLKEIQKDVRKGLFDFLATGTGTATATNFQEGLATAWGEVQTLFEDDGVNTLVFANPKDVAEYLGKANITTQTSFGMTFVSGFTGVTVVTNSNVPQGTLYATAPQNVVCAYPTVSGGELGKAFALTTDESGFIGVTHEANNETLSAETVAMNGVKLFAERLDGVVAITIA